MKVGSTPVEVFCSYAHEDEVWLRKLEKHLALLKRQGLISLWHDLLITPGTNRAKTIDTHLETASVILPLVSADFLASDYCYSVEMKHAIARHEAGEARVIPILVRPVDWKDAPFAHLQMLPTDAKPLSTRRMQETALVNITAGIRRAIEDVPLLADSAPCVALLPVWNIPYPRNPFFLGRDDELALVHRHLQMGQATALAQPQAISGLGGIGKTQLALEYAYRYHQDYQVVLWAHAESSEALVSSYIAIASLLRLPEHEAKEQNIIVQAVKTWLQIYSNWLVILDNADELMLLPDFLPPSLGGHLLLTTRATATGRLAHRLEIETFLPEQGALFLLRRAGLIAPDATLEQASLQERDLALKISLELGGLPLALDQAGAYLEETGTDLGSYWQIYQQHQADLLAARRGLVVDHPAPVATTWTLSFQKVEEKSPETADLLRMLAFLSPDAIPEELLTRSVSSLGPLLAPVAADAFRFNQAIEALRAYSLVRRDPKGKTLSIHRLVQTVILDGLSAEQKRIWAEQTVQAVNIAIKIIEAEPSSRPTTLRAWSHHRERYLPHLRACAKFIHDWQIVSLEAAELLDGFAHDLSSSLESYNPNEIIDALHKAIEMWEKVMGPDDLHIVSCLHTLFPQYLWLGRQKEAVELLKRASAIEQHTDPEVLHAFPFRKGIIIASNPPDQFTS